MWERKSYYTGLRCTVKFKGEIYPWPNTKALGVEWDNPYLGKHNGELNDIKYYECRVPNSGSFIKASRPAEPDRSFEAAVYDKYAAQTQLDEIKLSANKKVEIYGKEKNAEIYSQPENLALLDISDCRVKLLGCSNTHQFTNLINLDLSNNLLESFAETVEFLNRFPKLETLRLSGNRFYFSDVAPTCPSVTSLEMSHTKINDKECESVLYSFPNLKVIGLAYNCLESIPSCSPYLEQLDVAYNSIMQVDGIPEGIKWVNLMGNPIRRIPDSAFLPPQCDLRETPLAVPTVTDWASISRLGDQKVRELELLGTQPKDEIRAFLITRCPDVVKLDRRVISLDERRDAEWFTLNSILSKKHPSLPSQLWDVLIEKHGVPSISPNKSIRARLISFYVDDNPKLFCIVKDAPIFRVHILVARFKQQHQSEFQIRGITDVKHDMYDRAADLLLAGDLISDGQKLKTYTTSPATSF